MSDPRADVALLVDFTDLRMSLCGESRRAAGPPGEEAAEGGGEGGGEGDGAAAAPAAAGEAFSAREVARHLVRFAGHVGRLALARAYADWSRCAPLAREVSDEHLEPVLVPATSGGEDRSHIRLVVEALESLYTGDEPDAFVLVTGDSTLVPLMQKLRADGSEVVVVAPDGSAAEELRAAADRFYALEEVLDGVEASPARPRTWRGARLADVHDDGEVRPRAALRPVADGRRERPPHPTPVSMEDDFDAYDWSPFIRLIDELEHRLPFVGVRYLVNKVLGPHNCGIEDPRLKRDLINRAVESEVIEMYPVGNVGARSDPVTACRLNRGAESVVEILGETETPTAPAEQVMGSDPNFHT